MTHFADQITKLCLDKYSNLKNTGKPANEEWTVLSCVVVEKTCGELSVVALSTGTKCLSGTELLQGKNSLPRGSRLSDSHAEILARRAFLRYLYHQVSDISKSEIFYQNESSQIKLNSGVNFHFFSSQVPCGDCSIMPKDLGDEKPRKIQKLDQEHFGGEEIEDIHRTGAKCLEDEEMQDPHGVGRNYHILGPLRTKPGRGDRTLSLSCSDKIGKWIVVGVQGALLSLLIPTIKFKTIIIGGGYPFSHESMRRGLYERFSYNLETPEIMQSNLSFIHLKSPSRTRPCPSSIIWCDLPNRNFEVSVEGRKQGATKKSKENHLFVSKKGLFKTFITAIDESSEIQLVCLKKATYHDCKQSSCEYQELWKKAREKYFSAWPVKPQHLEDFYVE